MRRPTSKAIIVFIIALLAGYAISGFIMLFVLETEFRLYGFFYLTMVALLFAVLMMVWLDRPLGLDLFKWREAPPKPEPDPAVEAAAAAAGAAAVASARAETAQAVSAYDMGDISEGSAFPHVKPYEHWDADFSNPKEVYEGTALPIWILAGWAAFIIWAVLYLFSGLPGVL